MKKLSALLLTNLFAITCLASCGGEKKEYVSVSFEEIDGYSFKMKNNKKLPSKAYIGEELTFSVTVKEGYSNNYEVFANEEKLTLEDSYYTYEIVENTTFSITSNTSEEERYLITPLYDTENISVTYVVDDKVVSQPKNGFLKNTDLYMQFTFSGYDPESNYEVLINGSVTEPIVRNDREYYYYKVIKAATVDIQGLEKQKFSVTYDVPTGVTLTKYDGSEPPTTVEMGSTLSLKMTSTLDYTVGLFVNSNRRYADGEGVYIISDIRSNLRISVKKIEEGITIDKNSTVDAVYSFISNLTNSNGKYKVSFSEGYSLHHPDYLYQEYKNEGYISLTRPDKTDQSKALYQFHFDTDGKIKIGGLAIEVDQTNPSKYEVITDTSYYDPSLSLKVDGRLSKDKFKDNISYGIISEDKYILNFFTELSEASGSSYARVAISVNNNELSYKLYRYVDNGYESDDYSWGKISEVNTASEKVLDDYLASNPTLGESLKPEQVSNLTVDNVSVHSALTIVNVDSTGKEVYSKGVVTDVIINKDMFKVIEDFPDYSSDEVRVFQNINGVSNLVGVGGNNEPYYENSDGLWSQYLFPKDINYTSFRKESGSDDTYHYYGEEANKFIFTISRIGFTNGLAIEDITLKIENNKAKEMTVFYTKSTVDETTSYYKILITFNEPETISLPSFSEEKNDADINKALDYFKNQTFTANYVNESEGVYKEYRKADSAIYIKNLTSSGTSTSEAGYYLSGEKVIPFSYDLTSKTYVNNGKSQSGDSLAKRAANLSSHIFKLENGTLTIKPGVTAIDQFFLTGFLPGGIIQDTLSIKVDSNFKPLSAAFRLHGPNGDYDCSITFSNFSNTTLSESEINGLSTLKENTLQITTWKNGYANGFEALKKLYGEDVALAIPFVATSGTVTWNCSSSSSSVTIWFQEITSDKYNPSYMNNFEAALLDAGYVKSGLTFTYGSVKITFPNPNVPIMGFKFEKI